MRQNIALIVPALQGGGAEKQCVMLAKVLSEQNEVHLVVLDGSIIEKKYFEILGLSKVNIIRFEKSVLDLYRLYKVFKHYNVEISFSYLASANFMNALSGKVAKVPYLIGGIRNSELSRTKILSERIFHNYFFDFSISNSHSAVHGLSKKHFKLSKFHVIHNAFLLTNDKIIRKNTSTLKILSVARFVPQKDFLTALDAIVLLLKKLTTSPYSIKYYLVGYGEMEQELRSYIIKRNLQNNVEVIIKPDDIDYYYKNSDIFFVSSLFEGMSNSVMEAMSFSMPIVSTRAGDMEYLVKNEINGFLCKMKAPEEMAESMAKLVLNHELRLKMGMESYNILAQNFNVEVFTDNYKTFIQELVNKNK